MVQRDTRTAANVLFFITVAGAIIALDQTTKVLILKYMPLYKSIPIIPHFFSLSHVNNPGGAFGILAQNGSPLRQWLFLSASVLALGLVLYVYFKTPRTYIWMRAATALIFGGAIGNLIDRLRFGAVIDFLDFYIGSLHWPTFNMADSGVTVGVMIFLAHIIFKKMPF
jgi:signal peptidase II